MLVSGDLNLGGLRKMKKVSDVIIEKLLEMCKLIKWQNITEEEYEKMKGGK